MSNKKKRGVKPSLSHVPDPPYQLPTPPPLGLPPYYVNSRQRINDILSAMGRYFEADRSIPILWAEELVLQLALMESMIDYRGTSGKVGKGYSPTQSDGGAYE